MNNNSMTLLRAVSILVVSLIVGACSGTVTYRGNSATQSETARSESNGKKIGKRGSVDSTTSSVEQVQLDSNLAAEEKKQRNNGQAAPDVEVKDEEMYAAPQDISGLYLTADCSKIAMNADGSSDVQCQLQMPSGSAAAFYTSIEVMSIDEASMGGSSENVAGQDMSWSENGFSLHIRKHNGKTPINRVFLTVKLTAADSSSEIKHIRLLKKDIVQGWSSAEESEDGEQEDDKASGPKS